MLERLETGLRLAFHRARSFEPSVVFSLKAGPYTVKTVTSYDELVRCLRLRFQVFHLEYMQKSRVSGVDIDGLDLRCDHLAIIDASGAVVGTYRMNSSLYGDRFYSAGEFDLGSLVDLPGEKLELGRACIAREHRDGRVIAALWRGIAEYLRVTGTRYMFGCTSVKTVSAVEIAAVHRVLLASDAVDTSLGVVPRGRHRVREFGALVQEGAERAAAAGARVSAVAGAVAVGAAVGSASAVADASAAARAMIPSLLTSYLKMNAKVCGEPALDREFGCFDYLTLLDIEQMPAAYRARYQL